MAISTDRHWKPDDKDWVKRRKEEWRSIKPKLQKFNFIGPDEVRSLQSFYLTGQPDPDVPLDTMEASILLECWLTADQSEENWLRIRNSGEKSDSDWNRSRYRYNEIQNGLDRYAGGAGSVFSGLEERLYRFLFSGRFSREEFPHDDEVRFHKRAQEYYRGLAAMFVTWMRDKDPNPHSYIRWLVREWHDSLQEGHHDRTELVWLVQLVDKVLASPSSFKTEVVQLAEEINAVLAADDVPDAMKQEIVAIRAGRKKK